MMHSYFIPVVYIVTLNLFVFGWQNIFGNYLINCTKMGAPQTEIFQGMFV